MMYTDNNRFVQSQKKKNRDDVFSLVEAERRRQIAMGYNQSHDDEHTDGSIIASGWGALSKLLSASRVWADRGNYEKLLVQSAALIVAELERLKRKNGDGE